MGAICRLWGYLVKLLFGLSLVGLGILGLQKANSVENRIGQSITNLANLSNQPLLHKLKEHINILKYFDSALFVITGLLLILNFKGAGFFAFLAVALQVALLSNPLFYKDIKVLQQAVKFIAILGGVLTVA
jgi:hypothetical protein